jgi:centromere protein C
MDIAHSASTAVLHARFVADPFQGSVPEPAELLSSRRKPRGSKTHLPPPISRSPVKTHIGSSPRRRSSVAPATNGITASPRRATPTRRLDFNPDRPRPTIERSPGKPPKGQFHAEPAAPSHTSDKDDSLDPPRSSQKRKYNDISEARNYRDMAEVAETPDEDDPEPYDDGSIQLIGEENLDAVNEDFGKEYLEGDEYNEPAGLETNSIDYPQPSPVFNRSKQSKNRNSGGRLANESAKKPLVAKSHDSGNAGSKKRSAALEDAHALRPASLAKNKGPERPRNHNVSTAAIVRSPLPVPNASRKGKAPKNTAARAIASSQSPATRSTSSYAGRSNNRTYDEPDQDEEEEGEGEGEEEDPSWPVEEDLDRIDDDAAEPEFSGEDQEPYQEPEQPAVTQKRHKKKSGELRIHEDVDATSIGPPPKRSKTSSKQAPQERDPNIPFATNSAEPDGKKDLWGHHFKKPTARSLQILRECTPSDESRAVTRSGRRSVRPVEFWNGETIQRAHDGTMLNIVRAQSVEGDKKLRKKPSRKNTKSKSKSRSVPLDSVQEEGEDPGLDLDLDLDLDLEQWEQEGQLITSYVKAWDPELQFTLDEEYSMGKSSQS